MIKAMEELRGIVMRAGNRWAETGLPRVSMVRSEACSDQVLEPMLHLVLQGSKNLSIGDRTIRLDQASYLVVPVDVPATGEATSIGPDQPYLAVSLKLDPGMIAAMMAEFHENGLTPDPTGFAVTTATPEIIDAWLRMMRLIDRSDEAPMLAPLIAC
jgi:hypothetical protein